MPKPSTQAVEDPFTRGSNDAAQLLQSFVRRIEKLDGEIADLRDDRKEVMSEVKHAGFSTKILNIVLRRRKRKKDELSEEEQLTELYERAIEDVDKE